MSVRFSTADLDLFSTASHDRNPLHMSADYARRSPFGQRVVHGVLGALAVLAHTPAPPGRRVEQITLEFQRPIFIDTDYEVSDGSLMDGSTTLLKTEVQFVPGKPGSTEFVAGSARETAASLGELELVAGLELDGAYSPHPAAAALFERLKLDAQQWGGLPLAALLWSSYLAGMEIPGERALYFRFKIKFEPVAVGRGPLVWKARLKSRNALNLLRAEFELGIAGERVAAGEIGVLLRPLPIEGTNLSLVRSEDLAGKVALVTGASRGLGAAITRALALRGARVLALFQHSRAAAEQLRDEMPEGRVDPLQGDASDAAWCRAIRQSNPKIDFLVLNACPPVLPMRVERETVERVNAYIARALELVSVPLAVFADTVAQSTVLISTIYVESCPREFPHYVAAKAAAEGLLRVVARQHRHAAYLIVRPPKLRTDMTNTPQGSSDALAPEVVASQLADRLCRENEAGTVEIMGVNLQ